jgi:serine/threonine-protein kinase HipA
MPQAKVYVHDVWAGVLTEDDAGFHFQYRQEYLEKPEAEPVSLILPVSGETYHSTVLFPFFDGLIPEGWLLDIAQKNWKFDPRDRMQILLLTCHDCIGAVSIEPLEPS